jgi:hypothetical protein
VYVYAYDCVCVCVFDCMYTRAYMLTLVSLRSLHIAVSWASCSAPLAEFSASCCCMGVGNSLMLSKL